MRVKHMTQGGREDIRGSGYVGSGQRSQNWSQKKQATNMKRVKLCTPAYAPPPSWFDPRAPVAASALARVVATTPAARHASGDEESLHSARRGTFVQVRVRGRGARALAALGDALRAARTGAVAAPVPRADATSCAVDGATVAAASASAVATLAPADAAAADSLSRPTPHASSRRRRATDCEEDPLPAAFASESRQDVRGVLLRESAPLCGVAATQQQEPCSPQSQTL